jgi:hypothetical protein
VFLSCQILEFRFEISWQISLHSFILSKAMRMIGKGQKKKRARGIEEESREYMRGSLPLTKLIWADKNKATNYLQH